MIRQDSVPMNPPKRLTQGTSVRTWLFFLLPIAYVVQNPTLASYEDVASGLKPYHVVALLLFIVSASKVPRYAMLAALAYAVPLLLSSVANLRFDVRLLNAIGFLLVFMAAATATAREMIWARKGAIVAASAIIVVAVVHLPTILSSMSENVEGRSLYPTLLAGGVNIEATTLCILLAWIFGAQMLWTVCAVPLIYILMQTRSVIFVLPALWLANRHRKSFGLKSLSYRWKVGIAVGVTIVAIGLLSTGAIDLEKILVRFENIGGDDNGSMGRLVLYDIAFSSTDCYVLGCGVGAGAEMIRTYGLAALFEDNFHNVFLQQLIEVGVVGMAVYVAIFWFAYRGAIKNLKDIGLGAAIVAIFLMSFVQFAGYDFITAFLLGLGFSGVSIQNRDHNLR